MFNWCKVMKREILFKEKSQCKATLTFLQMAHHLSLSEGGSSEMASFIFLSFNSCRISFQCCHGFFIKEVLQMRSLIQSSKGLVVRRKSISFMRIIILYLLILLNSLQENKTILNINNITQFMIFFANKIYSNNLK